jgi:SRSO17 transposase
MPELSAPRSKRLEEFVEGVRGAFGRRDQVRWAAVYLRGLLSCGGRKTVENLARHAGLPAEVGVERVAQALQHFIHQSPWDEDRVLAHYQARMAQTFASAAGIFVAEEVAIVKQGRHSVGVQRQYSAALGRKANCQVAVALHYAVPWGHFPLALRLYLPGRWLQDVPRLDAAGVPEPFRAARSRTAIALELLDRARAAGLRADAVALGAAWSGAEDVWGAVAGRGLDCLGEVPPAVAPAARRGSQQLQHELGLNHFEGRSWRGFHHHACLAILAQAFLATQGRDEG